MKLKEIMNREVEVVHPDDTLQTAARKMRERDIGFLPVCDGERLVGALSDRDVTVKAIAEGMDPRTTRVKDVVHSRVIWCFDDQNVSEAARKMKVNKIRRLMVIRRDDKQLVGVVSLGDLVNNGSEKMTSAVLHSVSPTSLDT
jgi:CBS domain-containing protein